MASFAHSIRNTVEIALVGGAGHHRGCRAGHGRGAPLAVRAAPLAAVHAAVPPRHPRADHRDRVLLDVPARQPARARPAQQHLGDHAGAQHPLADAGLLRALVRLRGGQRPRSTTPPASAGAGWWTTITRITLPIARPALFASFILLFISILNDYDPALFLVTPGHESWASPCCDAEQQGINGPVAAMAMVQVAITIIAIAVGGRLFAPKHEESDMPEITVQGLSKSFGQRTRAERRSASPCATRSS